MVVLYIKNRKNLAKRSGKRYSAKEYIYGLPLLFIKRSEVFALVILRDNDRIYYKYLKNDSRFYQ